MKKLSKINESAWGDMMRRGSGEEIRTEDEFNDICEFIKNTYIVGFVGMDDIEFKDDHIHIPIYKVVGLNAFSSVDIYKNEITFSSIDPDKYTSQSLRKFVTYIKNDINQLFNKIKDTYSPEISTFDGIEHWIEFEINPKKGKVTKEFCEEVIDFILNNTTDDNNKILKILEKIPDSNTHINESAWGDMMRRGSGEEIRKEDDVNLLDRQGLVYYLKEHYKCYDSTTIIQTDAEGGNISVCLYEDTARYLYFLIYDGIDIDRRLYISGGFKETADYIYDEMRNLYTLTIQNDEDIDGHPIGNIRVEPKGCRYKNLTNKFFLEVLDFIIERIDKPLNKQIEKI